ncbi:hypothetical protein PF011_g11884 [Phytophthora fragariae]|uniref:Tc1-like transposase DDE domain-containing protein n=1 Tax=Phytophthora fragariae TaxID=53985 RepID=A0A6A3KEB0_9STRA|nr:hypothetical protein PF011_g11884 [Phytophthora fragariae]
MVAAHNGMPPTTARRLVASGRVEPLPRGGSRAQCVKCTREIKAAPEAYADENCTYTLTQLQEVRVEPQTCNNDVNEAKRKTFAQELRTHMSAGDFIVYYDETNFNVYCKRTQGRAAKEKRATVIHPPSKGANLQIQCAVSTEQLVDFVFGALRASTTITLTSATVAPSLGPSMTENIRHFHGDATSKNRFHPKKCSSISATAA